jgi:AcrR family transcriptional regulator
VPEDEEIVSVRPAFLLAKVPQWIEPRFDSVHAGLLLDSGGGGEYDIRHMATVKAGSKSEQTRERILRAAARAIRKHGYEGVGVADVMKEAGLTHGGFYAHFASRDELLAAAADQAGAESTEALSRVVARAKPGEELMALVDWYLDDRHVESHVQGLGCSIAAAGTEVPRQQAEVRRAAGRRIKDFIGLVERQFPDWGKQAAHEKAMAVVATLVGAVTLARAVGDPQISRAVRKSAREAIRAATAA